MDGEAVIQGVCTFPNVTKVVVARGVEKRTATVDKATGTWAVLDFPIIIGLNKISIHAEPPPAGSIPTIFYITRAEAIASRPTQRVALVWDADADTELEAIARGTLTGPLTDAQVQTFIQTVRTEVPQVFTRAYRSVANLSLVAGEGEEIHTVRFSGVDSGYFGLSPGDCGNEHLKQESNVFIGTYRDQFVGSFDDWQPMAKDDTIDVRAKDVAEALGRTAAHEMGHSLGLVADNGPCAWMFGCDGFHSCFAVQQINPGLSRFGGGFFIMDPGPRSANQARIAEVTRSRRTPTRRPATFSLFDQHYLSFIHPLP